MRKPGPNWLFSWHGVTQNDSFHWSILSHIFVERGTLWDGLEKHPDWLKRVATKQHDYMCQQRPAGTAPTYDTVYIHIQNIWERFQQKRTTKQRNYYHGVKRVREELKEFKLTLGAIVSNVAPHLTPDSTDAVSATALASRAASAITANLPPAPATKQPRKGKKQ
jgi:hypothetical protein